MDDKPAIEYHPFGTITLNFDDSVKLRRCRLGDLKYAKDLLEEVRGANSVNRESWVTEVSELRDTFVGQTIKEADLSEQDKSAMKLQIDRMNQLAVLLEEERIEIIYSWLHQVATRMSAGSIPPKDDWPLDLFDPNTPNDIIAHWQTRPLASGKTLGQNRTMPEANSSGPHLAVVSSPQEPQPQ